MTEVGLHSWFATGTGANAKTDYSTFMANGEIPS